MGIALLETMWFWLSFIFFVFLNNSKILFENNFEMKVIVNEFYLEVCA